MTKQRSDGLIFLVLGIAIFTLFGVALRFTASDSMADFRWVYNGARSLIAHYDPYSPTEFSKFQRAQIEQLGVTQNRRIQSVSMNLPPIFLFAVPLAMLPFGVASTLWMLLTGFCLVLASVLIWKEATNYAPTLSGALIGFLIANGAVLLGNGNVAGMVAGLCAIAVWCFLHERFVLAGVVCLAASLGMKPHDVALVWLYFLLAGGLRRKRALQVLAVSVIWCLPAVLWVSHVAPKWPQEFKADISASSSQGADSDPGPLGLTTRKRAMEEIIDLQAAVSIFRDDPDVYNPVTYLICGVFLVAWTTRTFRRTGGVERPETEWFALAAIVPVTLLLTYHRAYDSRLLLLTIPACCILLARGGAVGRLALLINVAAITLTGEIPLGILNHVTKGFQANTASFSGKVATLAIMRPASVALLAMEIFYLWIYLRLQLKADVSAEAVSASSLGAARS